VSAVHPADVAVAASMLCREIAESFDLLDQMVVGLTDPADVYRVLKEVGALKAKADAVEKALIRRVHVTLAEAGKAEVVVDGVRVFPYFAKELERWDGDALVSRVGAVCADMAYDRETGEVLPPAVFADRVATVTAKVLGGLAPSTKWRTSFLKEIGIDAAPYRTFERGAAKVGVEVVAEETAA